MLNAEQLERIRLRYSLAAEMAINRRVLEVSCGAGVGLGLFMYTARFVTACDISFPALALARQTIKADVLLVAADAHQLPYPDHSFDLILSFEAIYYLARPRDFLSECHRLLAENGLLLLSTSNPDWLYFVPGPLSVWYPSTSELAALLREAHFTAIQLYGSLPVDKSASQMNQLRAKLRQYALRLDLLRREHFLTRMLKRLAYGPLIPLPPLLPSSMRIASPFERLTLIEPNQRDNRHRVIFAIAMRS
ncbi:MAG: class I SAM-dependent methyltransferase [Anaerolineae bacterium]|nr:class I SAM-dependent methyltransferase [Anaerolineae bacterium]MDW8098146.1 class I SAM-dependent methyltransferase [Anaerolineae bacterium]